MSADFEEPRRIAGFSGLAADYRALLCDIWGVVHNGVEAHAPAIDALLRYRDGGGRIVLITNAPRPAQEVRKMLRRLKVPDAAYDAIVTSGDVTRHLFSGRQGRAMFHLGPERDRPVFEGFDFRLAQAGEADFVLCTGLFDDDSETPDDYAAMLESFRARGLEMICANPDLVVERGGRLVYCAGALAQAYEEMGGPVLYAGKPHPPIYELALATLADLAAPSISRRQVLAVGDSIRTDLKGAAAAGLDALFIIGGIHAGEHDGRDAVMRMFAEAGVAPRAVMDALRW